MLTRCSKSTISDRHCKQDVNFWGILEADRQITASSNLKRIRLSELLFQINVASAVIAIKIIHRISFYHTSYTNAYIFLFSKA